MQRVLGIWRPTSRTNPNKPTITYCSFNRYLNPARLWALQSLKISLICCQDYWWEWGWSGSTPNITTPVKESLACCTRSQTRSSNDARHKSTFPICWTAMSKNLSAISMMQLNWAKMERNLWSECWNCQQKQWEKMGFFCQFNLCFGWGLCAEMLRADWNLSRTTAVCFEGQWYPASKVCRC